MNSSKRFTELDVWRGLAISAMVIYHYFYLLDYLGEQSFMIPEGGWLIFARLIQWSFLLLVGISLHLSWQRNVKKGKSNEEYLNRQLKRGLFVIGFGMVITFVTWMIIPDWFIFFGILHLIGVTILLLRYIAGKPLLALFLSVIIHIVSMWTKTQWLSMTIWTIFGFKVAGFKTLDYFPIFPWMAIPALGIFLGAFLYRNYERRWPVLSLSGDFSASKILSAIGKKSLIIYMVHVPILIGIISGWNWIASM